MIRNVDLVSYLPLFMADFKEISATLEAENPEFVLVWNATDKVLKNEFIESADEYGITRFEKILGILPSTEDTIESRRARIKTRWFDTIPYTLKSFIAKLIVICGDNDFVVIKDYDNYKIKVLTNLEMFGQVKDLELMINNVIPCNMIINSENVVNCDAVGIAFFTGGVCATETFTIDNE